MVYAKSYRAVIQNRPWCPPNLEKIRLLLIRWARPMLRMIGRIFTGSSSRLIIAEPGPGRRTADRTSLCRACLASPGVPAQWPFPDARRAGRDPTRPAERRYVLTAANAGWGANSSTRPPSSRYSNTRRQDQTRRADHSRRSFHRPAALCPGVVLLEQLESSKYNLHVLSLHSSSGKAQSSNH